MRTIVQLIARTLSKATAMALLSLITATVSMPAHASADSRVDTGCSRERVRGRIDRNRNGMGAGMEMRYTDEGRPESASPLRSLASVLSDSLQIDSLTPSCDSLIIKIKTLNIGAIGIHSIELDSANNTHIDFIDPVPPQMVEGRTHAQVVLTPTDREKNAFAIIKIQDRTGKVWRVYYKYWIRHLEPLIQNVTFDRITTGFTTTKRLLLVNPTTSPTHLSRVWFESGDIIFRIDSTHPKIPTDLGGGDTLEVFVSYTPLHWNTIFDDTLKVAADCGVIKTHVYAESIQPCISVEDLDFGTLEPGESRTLPLMICNQGEGRVVFQTPYLTGSGAEFSVSASDIDRLKTDTLGPGDCLTIHVTFTANKLGVFRATGQFWANTTYRCRTSSTWIAVVNRPGLAIGGHNWGNAWVTNHNPCSRNLDSEYTWAIYAYNSGDRDFTVEKIELVGKDADDGYFKLDNSFSDTTIAPGDLFKAGDIIASRRLQRVIFMPKEERSYGCTVRLITTTGDTVENILQGIGVESHIHIGDLDFGTVPFIRPGNPTDTASVRLISWESSRNVTITGLRIGTQSSYFTIVGIRRADGTPIPLTTPFTPFTMVIDEVVTINVTFTPQFFEPPTKMGEIIVTGNFSGCDDSTGTLVGSLAIASVELPRTDQTVDRIEPNPFSSSTTIHFTLPAGAETTVEIYDGAGHRAALLSQGHLDAGEHAIHWEAAGFPAGIYYCRIQSGRWSVTRALLLVR